MAAYTVDVPAGTVRAGASTIGFLPSGLAEVALAGNAFPELDRHRQIAFRLRHVRVTAMQPVPAPGEVVLRRHADWRIVCACRFNSGAD